MTRTATSQAQAFTQVNDRAFSTDCTQCPRLATFLTEVKAEHPDYFCKPVPPFGDNNGRFLIVGLAPGKHGANATGRPFTGDYAGILLYETLHKFGFATAPQSISVDDGLQLIDCRLTNAVKCLPPDNKPITAEMDQCSAYLAQELANPHVKVVLALGGIAHRSVLKVQNKVLSHYPFGHQSQHQINHFTLVSSYHCSRYNTNTRRLTDAMFKDVFRQIRSLLDGTSR